MPTKAQISSALSECSAALPGDKTETADRWAKAIGISRATLYRHFRALGQRGPDRPRDPSKPEYRDFTKVVMCQISKAPTGNIPTHLALESCFIPNPETGEVLLPPSAEAMPLQTCRRILAEELGARQTKRRTRRLHARRANEVWLIDASTSNLLTVEKELDDGDYLLRLWRNPFPASGYKNKPLGPDRLRLIYYGIWEMHTGYKLARPTVARGESGLDVMEFMVHAMVRREDPRDPLHGVPEHLWSDRGPLVNGAATKDLLDRLEIDVPPRPPYAKEAMGGIEQVWRRMWESFEASLFLCSPLTGRVEFRLSQILARLDEYLARENARKSRSDPSLSRADHWVRSINQQGGAKLCPPDPMETLASERRCKVDQSGIIRWNREEYEVPKLFDCWVIARRAMDGSGRVVVEDERTGTRYDVTPFKPLYMDEWDGRQPALPIDKARKAAEALPLPGDVYAPTPAQAADTTVIRGRFGARSQPAAELPDPLDASRWASLPQAMAAFFSVFGVGVRLQPDVHAMIEARISEAGLDKTIVRDLALSLSTAIRTTGAYA